MPKIITEDMIEQAAIELLITEYAPHYKRLNCHTEKPETLPDSTGRSDKKQTVLPLVLFDKLRDLNPDVPEEVVKQTADELCRNTHGDPLEENYNRYQKIRNGIKVSYKKDGREAQGLLRLVDFAAPENNSYIVASQMWIRGEIHWRRPDLIIFINGLPLVFIELKNSTINVKNAYDKNLTDYRRDIPGLFYYNQICVLSNGMETRLGSFSAGYEHFFEWLKLSDEKENPNRKAIKNDCISLEYFLRGLCKPDALLDYVENFVLFDQRKGGIIKSKIIAKNHQFLGVNNAYHAFENREELHGKLGVFWHTQGSGKSYSMAMLARKIKHKCEGNFTFLIVTDRDDLDGQIYKTFLRSGFMSAEEKVQPASATKLREELATNKSIIFTLIHKFRYDKGKKYPIITERDDIVVFVDEAHRTQYKDLAENMRTGLPNAQFLAFTGTPLLGNKRLTHSWFGDYVSEYNFAESIKDNATVPLYYVKRVPEVELQNDFLESDFAEILEDENLTEAEQKRLENYYSQELEVIKRDDRLDAVAQHIVYHFPRRGFSGKGMVIAVDKFTAVKLYDKVTFYWKEEIKKLNAAMRKIENEAEKLQAKSLVDYMRTVEMAVVISEDADEKEKFRKEGLSVIPHRERMNEIDANGADIEDNFKDPNHPLSYSGNKRLAKLSVEQLLRDADVLEDEGLTYAALMLFGKRKPLLKHLPTAEVVYEFRTTEASGPAGAREDLRMGFFNFFDRIWELVNQRNENQHYQKRFQMLPVPTFNEVVVREALLNAVSHRNYQQRGSIFVRQYARKLVIESPGGFPPGVIAENILDKHEARNGLIAAVFQRCGLVERSGQGMNLIYEQSVREAKPLPHFNGSDDYCVKLTLDLKVIHPKMLELMQQISEEKLDVMSTEDYLLLGAIYRGEDVRGIDPARFKHLEELEIVKYSEHGIEPANGGVILAIGTLSEPNSDKVPINGSDKHHLILEYMTNHDFVTTAELSALLNVSQRSILKILKKLTTDKLVVKSGGNRDAKYALRK